MMPVLVLAITGLVTVAGAGAGEASILSIVSIPPIQSRPPAGTRQISAPPCQTTCHVSSVTRVAVNRVGYLRDVAQAAAEARDSS